MIILRSPKGWTGPAEVDGVKVTGTWRSHQVPLSGVRENPDHLSLLESHGTGDIEDERMVGRELFRDMLESAAADAGRPVRWIETRGQALDHPELLQVPESAYLKGAILQVLD